MPIQEGIALSGDRTGDEPEQTLYLLSTGSRRPVRCTTRWKDDQHAYVVAPLATARVAGQRWQALSEPVAGGSKKARGTGRTVELVSAKALMGADSGKEELVLRYFEAKPGAV